MSTSVASEGAYTVELYDRHVSRLPCYFPLVVRQGITLLDSEAQAPGPKHATGGCNLCERTPYWSSHPEHGMKIDSIWPGQLQDLDTWPVSGRCSLHAFN